MPKGQQDVAASWMSHRASAIRAGPEGQGPNWQSQARRAERALGSG